VASSRLMNAVVWTWPSKPVGSLLLATLFAALAHETARSLIAPSRSHGAYFNVLEQPSYLLYVVLVLGALVSLSVSIAQKLPRFRASVPLGVAFGAAPELIYPLFWHVGRFPEWGSPAFFRLYRLVDYLETPGRLIYAVLWGEYPGHWSTGLANPPLTVILREQAQLMLCNALAYALLFVLVNVLLYSMHRRKLWSSRPAA
jgi:hypothetical protein